MGVVCPIRVQMAEVVILKRLFRTTLYRILPRVASRSLKPLEAALKAEFALISSVRVSTMANNVPMVVTGVPYGAMIR